MYAESKKVIYGTLEASLLFWGNFKRAYKEWYWRSMGWNNLIVGSNELHSVEKSYIKVVNAVASFVETTLPTNTMTNKTILTQYSIKQGLKFFGKKG